MSLAATNMRGAFLNCRFAVNGIQKAFRSFGVACDQAPCCTSVPARARCKLFDRSVRARLAEQGGQSRRRAWRCRRPGTPARYRRGAGLGRRSDRTRCDDAADADDPHPAAQYRSDPRRRAGGVFDRTASRARRSTRSPRSRGLSKPNLLYYFPSKEAIHRAPVSETAGHLARPAARDRPGRRPGRGNPGLCAAQAGHGPRLPARKPPLRQRDPAGRAAHARHHRRPAEGPGRRQGAPDRGMGAGGPDRAASTRTT